MKRTLIPPNPSTMSSSTPPNNTTTTSNDEAFSDRVKKTFGTLFASLSPKPPSPSSLSNPLWSLTGSHVEKREWRRDTDTSRDTNPCSSAFDDFLSCARKNSKKNLQNYRNKFKDGDDLLDNNEDEDEVEEGGCGGGLDDWDLKSSIGLDSTLDLEEEEDTYDKVALGRENAGDRLYMRDVNPNIMPQDESPCDTGKRQRDSRANRLAARIRLKEDDAEATEAEQHKSVQAPPRAVNISANCRDGVKLKPILKRKGHEATSKPSKRVRFDPDFISDGDTDADANAKEDRNAPETTTLISGSMLNEKMSQVPDYVRNPSKYTRYSLDSDNEMDDKSNTEAYLESLETLHKSKNDASESEQEEALADRPKPITFVPRKKFNSSKADGAHSESTHDQESDMKRPSMQSSLVAGIASEEDQEAEVDHMDVDETETSAGSVGDTTSTKQSRQYRTKSQADEPA